MGELAVGLALHALGDVCPSVSDILHLGATSCYVTDNAELILMRQGLELLEGKLASAITAAVNTLDYNISKETAFCLAVLQFIPGTPK